MTPRGDNLPSLCAYCRDADFTEDMCVDRVCIRQCSECDAIAAVEPPQGPKLTRTEHIKDLASKGYSVVQIRDIVGGDYRSVYNIVRNMRTPLGKGAHRGAG